MSPFVTLIENRVSANADVKHCAFAQNEALAFARMKRSASFVPYRAVGILHARSALRLRSELHVPCKRNASFWQNKKSQACSFCFGGEGSLPSVSNVRHSQEVSQLEESFENF